MTVEQVVAEYASLSADDQRRVLAATAALAPPPADSAANAALWIIVVLSLSMLLVGGTVLLFFLINWEKPTEVIVPLVTGALGALAGLLAPSPVAQTNGNA